MQPFHGMFAQTFKNIDDVLRKDAGCTSELDYTEQSSWLLFLKYLDALGRDKAAEAALEGKPYSFILGEVYCWESWAAPKIADGKLDHNAARTGDDLRDFVNGNPRRARRSRVEGSWLGRCRRQSSAQADHRARHPSL
jgi:type I restriction enzyme M protein